MLEAAPCPAINNSLWIYPERTIGDRFESLRWRVCRVAGWTADVDAHESSPTDAWIIRRNRVTGRRVAPHGRINKNSTAATIIEHLLWRPPLCDQVGVMKAHPGGHHLVDSSGATGSCQREDQCCEEEDRWSHEDRSSHREALPGMAPIGAFTLGRSGCSASPVSASPKMISHVSTFLWPVSTSMKPIRTSEGSLTPQPDFTQGPKPEIPGRPDGPSTVPCWTYRRGNSWYRFVTGDSDGAPGAPQRPHPGSTQARPARPAGPTGRAALPPGAT